MAEAIDEISTDALVMPWFMMQSETVSGCLRLYSILFNLNTSQAGN